MASFDEIFGHLQSKIQAEKEGQCSYIKVQNVQDPKFNVKANFPGAISHTKKVGKQPGRGTEYTVHFKTPADAAEAAEKEIPGVTITVPRSDKKKKAAEPNQQQKEPIVPFNHPWKLLKRMKVVIRKHIKSLKAEKATVEGNERDKSAFEREMHFLQRSVQYLHTGSDILRNEKDYFENYEADSEVEFLKKGRVALEIKIQKIVATMKTVLVSSRSNPKLAASIRRLKRNYYCSEKLLQYLRGQKVAKVKQEVLELADIKEEPVSEDDTEVKSETED